ncbi:MAG: hypothetical protein LBT23_01565 [Synergistaceae bacterium]|jgi:hypothetical protein|nr:hypothetical protein [Synergistaceae bacterium]
MDFGDYSGKIAVIKCVINGHDANSNPIHGFCMGVMDDNDLLYHGELFSREPIDSVASLSELYAKLTSPRPEMRTAELSEYENSLAGYIASSRLLQGEKNIADPKAMEHKITYFCSSVLGLNAISFLEMQEMSREDLYLIIPALRKADDDKNMTSPGDEARASAGGADEEVKSTPDVVVACDPILDPVSGIPASALAAGDSVFCKLKEDSVFYSMMKSAVENFDGIVSGEVSAAQMNDMGSVTLAIQLSDGITGAIRIAGTVRVKAVRLAAPEPAMRKSPHQMAIAFAVAGVVAFLCVMGLLLRFLS